MVRFLCLFGAKESQCHMFNNRDTIKLWDYLTVYEGKSEASLERYLSSTFRFIY